MARIRPAENGLRSRDHSRTRNLTSRGETEGPALLWACQWPVGPWYIILAQQDLLMPTPISNTNAEQWIESTEPRTTQASYIIKTFAPLYCVGQKRWQFYFYNNSNELFANVNQSFFVECRNELTRKMELQLPSPLNVAELPCTSWLLSRNNLPKIKVKVQPASVAQWAETQCAPTGTVCRRSRGSI